MSLASIGEAAAIARRFVPALDLEPAVPAENMRAHMRSALARGLPQLQRCRPHRLTLNVAAGGPSLADTAHELKTYTAAINGSLRYLLSRGIVPQACGVLDPGPHMADLVVADPRVRYFVASCCHPRLFDKLLKAGCKVTLWHASGLDGAEDIVRKASPDNWLLVGGGCTMGLRWLTLGYQLGFRRFELHGLDSSFRAGKTHAYPDRADTKDHFELNGHLTRPNFVAQVSDFATMLDRLAQPDTDAIEIEVRGQGLLQEMWGVIRSQRPDLFRAAPVEVVCLNAGNYEGRGQQYVEALHRMLRQHATLPFNFTCFTDDNAEGYAVQVRPLPHPGLTGWWNKLALFKHGVFTPGTRVVYLDLDTIIAGDVDWLLRYRGDFAMLGPFFANARAPFAGPQSGLMAWRAGAVDGIWNAYETLGCPTPPGGDQAFINSCALRPDLWQDRHPALIKSFKGSGGEAPDRAAVVCFHGHPRPHEIETGWVPQLWRPMESANAQQQQ